MIICKQCQKEHDGEHLELYLERYDTHGMESLQELQQHMVEQSLCLECVEKHPDQERGRLLMPYGTSEDLLAIEVNLATPASVNLHKTSIPVWAIMHVPTGKLLPESHGGYTQQEPTCPSQELPRLFHDPATARRARAQYIKGIHSLHRSGGRSMYDDDYEEYIEVSNASWRRPEDYEVVALHLGGGRL